jgi:low temperature requirement protein LtrA
MSNSKSRIPLLCYVVANLISIILWGISLLFIDSDIHFALWYVGLFVELLVNLVVRDNKRLSWAASHLAERFGLLTLIVLGEYAKPLSDDIYILYSNSTSFAS